MLDIKYDKFSLPDRARRSGPAPQNLWNAGHEDNNALSPTKAAPAMMHVIDASEDGRCDIASPGFWTSCGIFTNVRPLVVLRPV